MHDISIKIKNYKCFVEETGFNEILRINIIIGRNNSGKSSLLDIIEILTVGNYQFDVATHRNGQQPQIIYTAKISENEINRTFSSNHSGGLIGQNYNDYGQQYVGREIKWTKSSNEISSALLISCDDEGITPSLQNSGEEHAQRLTQNIEIPLEGKSFRRVLAERDIFPEPYDINDRTIKANGNGITNAIQSFINRSDLPSRLVENDILLALNEIFAHDAIFTSIVCQLHGDKWEIYLEEEHKGRIALSKSGSGLKTVITVLACLFLVPVIEGKALNTYIFGFEELENNIHPALLRRLNDYIYRSSIENDFLVFHTTHSNVLIDQFSKQEDAQILHIRQSESISNCNTAKTYIENNGILDDLDVRASDLLQANGVIWVEGPSDRVYMNRWIALWSDDELKEGTHYQIIFYGGRLLSHLSGDTPEEVDSAISILNTNRNAIIMIDSDKREEQSPINSTKERIAEEFEAMNSICWITEGKEIENYIPSNVVDEFLEIEGSEPVGQYLSFFDHVEDLKEGEGKRYIAKKPLLAEKIIHFMTLENMSPIFDLDEKMVSICTRIRRWNS